MAQEKHEPKPTPPPTPPGLPPDSPYRPLPGENIQQYLARVPGPVKVLSVETPDPFEGCEQRHRDRAKAISKALGLK